jgi:CBS domain-containing protein
MQSMKVKELMIPLAEYTTVSEKATLREAVLALEEAQQRVDVGRERHRAMLVLDNAGRVTGKLGMVDVVRGLEPKYRQIEELKETSRYLFDPQFIRSMMQSHGLWRKPLEDLCRKAAQIRVKDIMHSPSAGECVSLEASLEEAVHQLIVGRHPSLLVTKDQEIVGILRLVDVFKEIGERIKACEF